MEFINKQFLKSAIYGTVVADALGVPFEFCERDSFIVCGMSGGGFHDQPAGTWSDDSSMIFATLDSFIKNEKLNFAHIMTNFRNWIKNGDFTPYGKCFDYGITTSEAVTRFEKGENPVLCGGENISDNGNGSLMRIIPIAFVNHTEDDISDLSSLTHRHGISCMCCRLYVELVENLMDGMSKEEAVKRLATFFSGENQKETNSTQCEEAVKCLATFFGSGNIDTIKKLPRDKIRSSGYVVDTLEAAVWSFLVTDNYRDCVITAVELGEDTDTVGAVAGGLAGIYYGTGGEKGIPESWVNTLAKKDWIDSILSNILE